MSLRRPFEEQTPLERVLRAHLWHPTDALRRAEENLPQHARKKQYRQAADCLDAIVRAQLAIKDWQHILDLYEAERSSRPAKVIADE